MSDTTERVSALEQTLRDKAFRCEGYGGGISLEANGSTSAYRDAADMLHERDAQLWRLADKAEADAERVLADEGDWYYTRGEIKALRAFAEDLRAILEGKTE